VEIRLRIPVTLRGELLANLLGLLGLLGVAVALGAMLGNWWVTVLAVSIELVALAYVAHSYAAIVATAAEPVSDRPVRAA
jgi:hypothetical protein